MSYAIYGESHSYVFLVTESSREKAVNSFLRDVEDVGVKLSDVFNIFAAKAGRQEDKDTEDFIRGLINEANE